MVHLIDKDALVAEIDRQKIGYNVDGKHSVEYDITKKIIDIINTLDVKEVDLEKEIHDYHITKRPTVWFNTLEDIAKHFFELGLKVHKGE